jgi:hypothetical protein
MSEAVRCDLGAGSGWLKNVRALMAVSVCPGCAFSALLAASVMVMTPVAGL